MISYNIDVELFNLQYEFQLTEKLVALQINKFCSEENHNRFAPNRQNRICQEKSAWKVMRSLPDFGMDVTG